MQHALVLEGARGSAARRARRSARPRRSAERQLEGRALEMVDTRMNGLSGFTRACSGGVPNRYSGWVTMNWSSGALVATKMAADGPLRRPARPACCQSDAIVRRDSRRAPRRRGGRCRRRARARWSTRRPAPRRSAEPLLDRAAARRQIAAAIAAHDAAVARAVGNAALDRRQQDLGGQPALREHDGRDLLAEEPMRQLRGLAEVRRANPQLRVDDGRVVADEDRCLPGRGAALRDLLDRFAGQPLRQLAGDSPMVAEAMTYCGADP